jgi:uncharacterized protein (TIGR02246 family)
MFKQLLYIGLLVFSLSSCTSDHAETDGEEAIRSIMQAQEDAWNKGDLEGFMKGYLESDSLLFIGSNGLRQGWQATLDGYKRSYSTPEQMGKLQFENLKFKTLSDEVMLVIGRWTLYRSSDTLSGHYSLNWQKRASGWKIIADHSS